MARTKYINWGIASKAGKYIYVNKRLKMYPELLNALRSHENKHTDTYSVRDIIFDLDIEELKGLKWQYYKFILKNPTTWVEFLPLKRYEGVILFNLPLLLIWMFLGGVAWLVIASLI